MVKTAGFSNVALFPLLLLLALDPEHIEKRCHMRSTFAALNRQFHPIPSKVVSADSESRDDRGSELEALAWIAVEVSRDLRI